MSTIAEHPEMHAALVDTGLPAMALDRPIASLSGGERTRAALAPGGSR